MVLHALRCIIYALERKEGKHLLLNPQAAQAQFWVRDSEVIWSKYTRIISVLSDAK